MKIVMQYNDRTVREWNVAFDRFGLNAVNRCWWDLSALWKDACHYRDNAEHKANYRFLATIPMGDPQMASANAIFTMNVSEFCRSLQFLLNSYLPMGIGSVVLKTLWDEECDKLLLEQLIAHAQVEGKLDGFPTTKYGIFSFHYYDGPEWAKVSLDTIAAVSLFAPMDVQDYSQICRAARRCPAGAHPMIWLNPVIANTYKAAYDSKVTLRQMQMFVSSFIIISAFNAGDDIDDELISQFWESFDNFVETEDYQALNVLYMNAEQCILIDSGHARIADVPEALETKSVEEQVEEAAEATAAEESAESEDEGTGDAE